MWGIAQRLWTAATAVRVSGRPAPGKGRRIAAQLVSVCNIAVHYSLASFCTAGRSALLWFIRPGSVGHKHMPRSIAACCVVDPASPVPHPAPRGASQQPEGASLAFIPALLAVLMLLSVLQPRGLPHLLRLVWSTLQEWMSAKSVVQACCTTHLRAVAAGSKLAHISAYRQSPLYTAPQATKLPNQLLALSLSAH